MPSLVLMLAVLAFTSACSPCQEDRTRLGVSALQDNIQKWRSAEISSYVLSYTRGGGMLPPSMVLSNRVVVSAGAVTQVELLNSEGTVVEQVEASRLSEFYTVESLFDEIGDLNRSVKTLEVQYNPTTGIPTRIYVDPNYGVDGCGDVSDDEYSIVAAVEF